MFGDFVDQASGMGLYGSTHATGTELTGYDKIIKDPHSTPEQIAQAEEAKRMALAGEGGGKTQQAFTPHNVEWGGSGSNLANYFSEQAEAGSIGMANSRNWAMGEAQRDRGPQALESALHSQNEANSRNHDQAGALQLAREAAMGMAPSEAAYMMQRGLDQSTAQQAAMAGGARGAAGLATAQTNAGANVANMQQNTFTQAGQLRAQEMAAGRGLYGGLAGQQREQDQQRLGMSNQMGQFNAQNNDAYRLGMAGTAAQFDGQSQGWHDRATSPYDKQAQLDSQYQGQRADAYHNAAALAAGKDQAANDRADMWGGRGAAVIGGMGGTFAGGPVGGAAGSHAGLETYKKLSQ
jgi:hypothetical protein